MPAFQTVLGELNRQFSPDRIAEFAKARTAHFAPGNSLDLTFLVDEKTPLHRAWKSYLELAPVSFRETMRGIVHHALSTSPPTQVTFAWAPGYDYELTMWQAPDTQMTKGGITVLLKSRYPDDKHPLQR